MPIFCTIELVTYAEAQALSRMRMLRCVSDTLPNSSGCETSAKRTKYIYIDVYIDIFCTLSGGFRNWRIRQSVDNPSLLVLAFRESVSTKLVDFGTYALRTHRPMLCTAYGRRVCVDSDQRRRCQVNEGNGPTVWCSRVFFFFPRILFFPAYTRCLDDFFRLCREGSIIISFDHMWSWYNVTRPRAEKQLITCIIVQKRQISLYICIYISDEKNLQQWHDKIAFFLPLIDKILSETGSVKPPKKVANFLPI